MSSENKRRKRNLPIPEEAISGAAGINDKFEIEGYEIEVACEKDKEIPTKSNTKTLVANPNQRKGEYDIGLQEGMVIPVKAGGIEISKQGKDQER